MEKTNNLTVYFLFHICFVGRVGGVLPPFQGHHVKKSVMWLEKFFYFNLKSALLSMPRCRRAGLEFVQVGAAQVS